MHKLAKKERHVCIKHKTYGKQQEKSKLQVRASCKMAANQASIVRISVLHSSKLQIYESETQKTKSLIKKVKLFP